MIDERGDFVVANWGAFDCTRSARFNVPWQKLEGANTIVVTATDGPSALILVRGEQPIDLLFSDVVMPGGIDGFELIKRARAIRSGLKALVTSGYANIQRPGADRPDVPLLLKPYRRGDLAQCIRMALDRI